MSLALDNLPTPKIETWKYTNLKRVMPGGLPEQGTADKRVIHIARGQDGGIEEILWNGEDGTHHNPVLDVSIEEGGQLTLIERHEGEGAYWKNMDVQITLAANAHLRHIRIFEDSADGVCTVDTHITQAQNSSYHGFYLQHGSKLTRNEITAALQGQGADCHLTGLNLLKDKQHGDTTAVIEHQVPHCSSHQFFRSLLNDQARGVFQGKVHVHEAAQKSDAYQLSNAILLSPLAEMDTKPELEIYADDVQCSHGATTGALDEEPLFYMRSRGIGEDQAWALLLEAFANEVTDKIGDEAIKSCIQEKVQAWLKTR